MDIDRVIGSKLRHLRLQRNIRLVIVAEALGMSPPKLSRWETGKYAFKASDLFVLSRYWGVTIIHLCVPVDRSEVTEDVVSELSLFLWESDAGWRQP